MAQQESFYSNVQIVPMPKTIMIVEDNELNMKLFRDLIEAAGYQSVGTANGFEALYSNTTGSANTANAYLALHSNTTGINNTANGYQSIFFNTTGNNNTASGFQSLVSNTTGSSNTATGYQALNSNTTGHSNTANGYVALNTNTTGYYNTADGIASLFSNTIGIGNTGSGYAALNNNSTGNYNTGVGQGAIYNTVSGDGNTALGYGADVTTGNLTNATVLGFFASVNASNKVVVGNASVNVIGGQVGWSNFSDGRFKSNLQEDVPGLAFINKLKPVTYNLEVKKFDQFLGKKDSLMNTMLADYAISEKKIHTGFVAQDVEKAALELHYDFDGVNHPQNDKDNYSLVYAQFVPSLVKAVQEQQLLIEELKKENENLRHSVTALQVLFKKLENSSAKQPLKETLEAK